VIDYDAVSAFLRGVDVDIELSSRVLIEEEGGLGEVFLDYGVGEAFVFRGREVCSRGEGFPYSAFLWRYLK